MSRQLTLLLGNRKPSGELTYSVDRLYTYRYVGANRRWDTVYNWRYVYGFSITQNIFGTGDDNKANSMRVNVPAMAFTGKAKKLTVKFSRLYISSSSNHTFRWAVCTAQNDAAYEGYAEVPDSAIQLAHGTFTPEYKGSSYYEYTFDFDVGIPNKTPIYVYIWAANNRYGNCHVDGTVSIEIS